MSKCVFALVLLLGAVPFYPVLAQDEFTFALNLADPAITEYRGPCYAHLESGFRTGELVLLLPGRGYQPNFYDQFVIQAARLGHHGLALKYVDDPAYEVQTACASSSNPDCFFEYREEMITGSDLSSDVAVDRVNSIEHRLIVALQYLDQTFPGNGWDQFWTSDSTIAWNRIRLVGHEEGAGYAATVAKLHQLPRVVTMGWGDWDEGNNAAPAWLSQAGMTPSDRWYAFSHQRDEVVDFTRQEANWDSLGLSAFGATVDVDGSAHPYNDSHQLTTDVLPNLNQTAFNDAVVVSSFVPPDVNGPVFLDVWSYLIDGSTRVSIEAAWKALGLRLYPQPATEWLQLEGITSQARLRMYTLQGQRLALNWSPGSTRIDISALPPGYYLLEVTQAGQIARRKLLVQ